MVKDKATVINEFNHIVNMDASELRGWLETGQSQSSGWHHAEDTGETIGHESGRRIVEILEHNPSRNPPRYEDDDIGHMRRVVSYCKRHLAQEEAVKRDPGRKSYRSLKNWGHDPLKVGPDE